MTYLVAIEVRKMYHVEITADSEAEAEDMGNQMQSLKIYDEGRCANIETVVVEVELIHDESDDEGDEVAEGNS